MESVTDQIQEIELNIKEAEELVELANQLDKLEQNRAFKKLILENYMEKEPVRLTMLLGHPNMQDADNQKAIMENLKAVSNLQHFFNVIRHRAYLAQQAISANREEIQELYKEAESDLDN